MLWQASSFVCTLKFTGWTYYFWKYTINYSKIKIFIKQDADLLPPHRLEDYSIKLLKSSTPPFARNYKLMTTQKLEAVKKYLNK